MSVFLLIYFLNSDQPDQIVPSLPPLAWLALSTCCLRPFCDSLRSPLNTLYVLLGTITYFFSHIFLILQLFHKLPECRSNVLYTSFIYALHQKIGPVFQRAYNLVVKAHVQQIIKMINCFNLLVKKF